MSRRDAHSLTHQSHGVTHQEGSQKRFCDVPFMTNQVAQVCAFGAGVSSTIFAIDLSSAHIVRDRYLDRFLRGIAAAVRARDGSGIDASVAVALSLGSK